MSPKKQNERHFYSTKAAAARLDTTATALRRKLERALKKSADGKARLGVVVGIKFGRSWRVAFYEDQPDVVVP